MYPRAHWYLLALLMLTALAFWPGYLTKLQQSPPITHFHGITATLWMLLLIGQAWFAARRRFALHRALGRASYVVAPLFVIGGLGVVHRILASEREFFLEFGRSLGLMDTLATLYFAAAVGLAIHYRQQVELHARLMLSTAILLFPAVFSRFVPNYLAGNIGFLTVMDISFVAAELAAIALVLDDRRRGGIRAPYVGVLVLTLVQHASFRPARTNPLWGSFAEWYSSLPLT